MAKLRKISIEASTEDGKHSYDTHVEYNPNSQVFFIRVSKDQIDFEPEPVTAEGLFDRSSPP